MTSATTPEASDAPEVPEVAYTTVDSPIGQLLLAATPDGLVRVAFEREGFDQVLADLSQQLSAPVQRDATPLGPAVRQLDEYFAGRRRTFELQLDHAAAHGFRAEVQRFLPEIPYGQTRSYTEVATALGSPGAVRAVGSACATNPLPVVVPCHRVLRSDGSLGGYLGGLGAKTLLLSLERAESAA